MSLNNINPDRLRFLVEYYSLTPEAIAASRNFMSKTWHVLQGIRPIDKVMSDTDILNRALEQAKEGVVGNIKKTLGMRPPRIHISNTDLNIIQENKTKLFVHPNHQKYFDIPYVLQSLKELIGTDAGTHAIMKKGIPFIEKTLISGGGIMLLRGRDLKKLGNINKARSTQGLPPLDIMEQHPELLRVKELPEFLSAFTVNGDRNMMIFPQGTRQTEKKGLDPFVFETKKVIPSMQQNINATEQYTHVVIAVDYRGVECVDISLRILSEDEMRNSKLGDTVNGFLEKVRDSK